MAIDLSINRSRPLSSPRFPPGSGALLRLGTKTSLVRVVGAYVADHGTVNVVFYDVYGEGIDGCITVAERKLRPCNETQDTEEKEDQTTDATPVASTHTKARGIGRYVAGALLVGILLRSAFTYTVAGIEYMQDTWEVNRNQYFEVETLYRQQERLRPLIAEAFKDDKLTYNEYTDIVRTAIPSGRANLQHVMDTYPLEDKSPELDLASE